MLKIKISKEQQVLLSIIKNGNFFSYTYRDLAEKMWVKKEQCVVNNITSLENRWLISVTRWLKKRRWKWYDEIIANETPIFEIVYES